MAAWFLFGSGAAEVPEPAAAEVSAEHVASTPRRQPLGDPPMAKVNSFVRDCQDCHQIFKFERTDDRPLYQHTHIKLEHGMNKRCLSCHYGPDRNRLALAGGASVPFDQVPLLCAKCHGPLYRDWQLGVHGRATGSWQSGSPKRGLLRCVECHDPHVPRYPPHKPLPRPNTLRMGDPVERHHGSDNPLLREPAAAGKQGAKHD